MASKMLRINGEGLSELPENGEWGIALFCYPNTRAWRGVIRGMFARLGTGWTYKNCNYGEVAEIGREIERTLEMDCKQVFEDIRDCVCRIAQNTGGLDMDLAGAVVTNETACLRAKSAVSMAYFWAMQLSKVKSGILNLSAPLFSASSPLSILDDVLADGWAKDSAGAMLDGLSELFVSSPLEFFGVTIPSFAVRDDSDYKGLMQVIEDNQGELIQSIYESCTPQEAKQAFDAVVDSLFVTQWEEDYLKTMVSESYLISSFDGSLSKLYQVSGVGDWISYDCVGAWPCESCVLVDGPETGEGFTNWDGASWNAGAAVVQSAQETSETGPFLPYLIKFTIASGGIATFSNLLNDTELEINSYNENCELVSSALWDGVGTYTTPACSKVRVQNTDYPFYSYSVNLEVSL